MALRQPSLKPNEAAILNAFSFESTSWYEPKVQRDLDVDDRVAGQHAVGQRFLDALLRPRG